MRKLFLINLFLITTIIVCAQSPVVKLDINMSGRSVAECNDPSYTAWIPDNSASISKTVDGITFTFSKGSNGEALRADWYKAGVQAPSYARLVCDGMRVDGADNGAEITLTISGLSTGSHTILTYHNGLSSQQAAPIDVLVNGVTAINNLAIPLRATSTSAAAVSYLTFNATAGQNTSITYRAETGTSDPMKNVYICGVELNTPNFLNQAKDPYPTDKAEHQVDPGAVEMFWSAASGILSHDVYFGTNEAAVANATISSPEFRGNQSETSFTQNGLVSNEMYFWRIDEINSNGTVTKGNVWSFRPRQLAFPGAEGYGRYAIGGRGGQVVHVTNLNDDNNPGSLRYAVENIEGPRTIVFDVAGMITLTSRLVLNDPYVTIAGQTAPGKGVCIKSAPFGFTGNDLIARHIRLRLGAGRTFDGMGMTGANHSILDHCSISWTIDESFSSRGSKNITLQRALISEALNAAGHQNYPAGTEHGYAATIGGDVGSFHHNLLAHNYGRNWSMGGGLDGNGYYAGRLDISNNVVYNWGNRTTDGGAYETNFINNYYKPGAGSKTFNAMSIQHENTGLGTQKGYFSGNVMPGYFNENNQQDGYKETYHNGDYKRYEGFVNAPFFESYITMQSAYEAYKDVLSDCGANQPFFDNHDVRMINETINGTYSVTGSVTGKKGFPDHQNDAGGYESYPTEYRAGDWDSDGDGMPNWWERMMGFNENSSTDDYTESNSDDDGNGYTALEEYLNWMAEPHFFNDYGNQVSIDLKALFRGYTNNPSYSFANVEGGSISMNGAIAVFSPNGCGLASFELTVNDGDGDSKTRAFRVFTESQTPGSCTLTYYDCAGVEDGTAKMDDCGVCSGGTTGVIGCADALQGEGFCEAIGVEEASNLGFIGTGYVNFDNEINSSGSWNIYATSATTTRIGIRYANGGGIARPMTVNINGNALATFTGEPSGGWTNWQTETFLLDLEEGVNNIELVATTTSGGPNVDLLALYDERLSVGGCVEDCNGVIGGSAYLDSCNTCVAGNTGLDACHKDCAGNWGGSVTEDDCGVCLTSNNMLPCTGSLEAETACSFDGSVDNNNAGFSGDGFANTDNVLDASATWILNSNATQTATFTFRYANGGTTARDGEIWVNGQSVGIIELAPTGDWTTWANSTINVDLEEGANEIIVVATTENGLANIDIIHFSEGVSDAQCGTITVLGESDAFDLEIYPNPVQNTLTINKEVAYIIESISGELITTGTDSSIDTSTLPIGIYLLKVEGEVFKVIKE